MSHPQGERNSDDPDRLRLVEEAASWFARMQGRKPTGKDRKALQDWLAADARHAAAYADIERLWDGSIALPGFRERDRAARSAFSRRTLGKAVLAAGVGLGSWRYLANHPFADYSTATGERRIVVLPDGSTMDLAAETRLSLDFTEQKRRLVLHAGEAFFTVAASPARPFVVEAGSGSATALGTAFGVAFREDEATVIVTESVVEVSLGTSSTRLAAGSAVNYSNDRIAPQHPSQAATELAWREGRLVFANAPLGQVVAALNRWRPERLVVMSQALAARPVTLIVNLKRSDAIVAQLAQAVPIRIVDMPFATALLFPAD